MTATACRDAALLAHENGISVVPPKQDGTKMPRGSWKGYQETPADREQITRWYAGGRLSGLGFVCGHVSGNLEMLEFEDEDTYRAYENMVREVELGDVWDRVQNGYLERTPGGGYHTFVRCEEIAGNTKLARRPKRPEEMRDPQDKVRVLIETRGEGGYAIVAPSNGKVHPSGGRYELLRGGPATIATITPGERRELWNVARSFDEMPGEHPGPNGTANGSADNPMVLATSRPGDDYNERGDVVALLERHGWTVVYRQGEEIGFRRPGKGLGLSATYNHGGHGYFYCFSTSTPFEAERGYRPFAVYAILEHAGDHAAAAKELAGLGYGAPAARIVTGQRGQLGVNGSDPESPRGAGAMDAPHLSDLGNAHRLVAHHGNDLRYCPTFGKWLAWDGQRWQLDELGEVYRRAKRTVMSIYGEATAAGDDNERKAVAKHALRSEGEARIKAMIGLAESEPGIPIRPDQLDRDRWLLNVRNGTLALRTGEIHPHERTNLISKLAPVDYDPDAKCPMFIAFLDRIMEGKTDLIRFLQRAAGYSLTGDTSERALLILHGEGRNGKSTLLETLRDILGDYAIHTPTDTLLAKRDSSIPNDVARLKGMRLVTASEADEGRRFDEARVKELTGGDTISARFMRGEFFDFLPEFTLWLGTNHKPVIRGTDRAIWDRIRLIPFNVRIPDDEQDKQLKAKLLTEASGILNWALAGCLEWQRDGLGEPEAVKQATAGYRAEMDVLGGFIDDRCLVEPTASVAARDLYAAYDQWCQDSGEKPMTRKAMGLRLAERGFDSAREGNKRTRTWIGIGLLDDQDRTMRAPK